MGAAVAKRGEGTPPAPLDSRTTRSNHASRDSSGAKRQQKGCRRPTTGTINAKEEKTSHLSDSVTSYLHVGESEGRGSHTCTIPNSAPPTTTSPSQTTSAMVTTSADRQSVHDTLRSAKHV